ncbi:Hint domain-containing protein [Sagittula sp. NFXS13]|uniref:Hint domain-containing protein n=1 Tax=Sagittula sp. NFXS13 TaxID=2819095 RepID=UPI0032DE815F
MATYLVTTGNWNSSTFWSGIDAVNGDTLDMSALGAAFSVDFDAAGVMTISDDVTSFTIGDAGAVGTDSTLNSGSLSDFQTLQLSQGDDTVTADGDANVIMAGDGDDSIDSGDGDDTVDGGAGDDTLSGGSGNDSLTGGDGDDLFFLEDNWHDDTLIGGEAEETAGDRVDFSALTKGVEVSYSADEAARFSDGVDSGTFAEIENVTLTEHADTLDASATAAPINAEGLGGDDSMIGSTGADSLDGGDGNDTLRGAEGNDTITGGTGDDSIYGNGGDDILFGGDGSDSLYGETGNDEVHGGAGDDTVEGNEGDDTLYGGDGNDWMRGSYDNDILYGGAGDDYLWGGWGDDTFVIENGFGNDTVDAEGVAETDGDVLDLSAVTDDLTVDLTHVNPEIGTVTDGQDTLNFNEIETIRLGGGRDTLVLADGSGADRVTGFDLTDSGDGSTNDQLDVTGLTDIDGAQVNTADVTVTDDGAGNAVLSFPNGESLTLMGVAPSSVASPAVLATMGIPTARDEVVTGTSGADTIDASYMGDPEGDRVDAGDNSAGNDDDSIEAGAGDDSVVAGAGNDTVQAGDGNDTVEGGAGDDSLDGGAGADTLLGDAGADTLIGGDGDDSLSGGDGRDTLLGGAGDDDLSGGAGGDSLDGGSGADTLQAGSGDTVFGGDGDDTFNTGPALNNGGAFSITGGEGDETLGDTLNITGPATIAMIGPKSGTVKWLDGSKLTFSEIENINYVPCFTPGTRIKTATGEADVADIRVGDRVLTRDNGYQTVRWCGSKSLTGRQLHNDISLQPIRIRANAFGQGMPERDMLVSPQHRVSLNGALVQLLTGEDEVLAASGSLTHRDRIKRVSPGKGVTYVHFMFDRHELVNSDGAWTESFQPGDMSLAGLDNPQREELFRLFPDLICARGQKRYAAARPTLKAYQAKLMTEAV